MKNNRKPHDIEQKLINGLRDKGYKLTQQRLEIIKLLARDISHPGAMDILQKVRKSVPRTSTSTVYYTLDMLKREGLIRELEFYDRENRYDVNVSNHINLICTECGKIGDFMEDVPLFYESVEKKTGFKPVNIRFEYYGLCKECKGVKSR
jgi:Fe2+ or Zn2+ uptake regulation protein